jgi:hypothetical protein
MGQQARLRGGTRLRAVLVRRLYPRRGLLPDNSFEFPLLSHSTCAPSPPLPPFSAPCHPRLLFALPTTCASFPSSVKTDECMCKFCGASRGGPCLVTSHTHTECNMPRATGIKWFLTFDCLRPMDTRAWRPLQWHPDNSRYINWGSGKHERECATTSVVGACGNSPDHLTLPGESHICHAQFPPLHFERPIVTFALLLRSAVACLG